MGLASRIDMVSGDKPLPIAGYVTLYIDNDGQVKVLYSDNSEIKLGASNDSVGNFPAGSVSTNKLYAQRTFGGF